MIKIAINQHEFGEIYHIGAAMVLCENFEVYLVGDDVTWKKKFIDSITSTDYRTKLISEVEYSELKKRDEFKNLSYMTKIISVKYLCDKESRRKIRDAFLKKRNENEACVRKFLNEKISDRTKMKILIWIRNRRYDSGRNSTIIALKQLRDTVKDMDLDPIFIGNTLVNIEEIITDRPNFIRFYEDHPFEKDVLRQLLMFELMRTEFNVKAQIGMMSGGMDGPAFLGMPTIWFATRPVAERRMDDLIDILPQYKKITILKGTDDKFIFVDHTETELYELRQRLEEYCQSS